MTNKIICLVDGEHYLPVTKSAISVIDDLEHNEVVSMVFIGGTEKLKTDNPKAYSELMGFPVYFGDNKDEIPYDLIEEMIDKYEPDVIMDLSDEPVLDYSKRFKIACRVIAKGVIYEGTDFRFEPPTQADIPEKPSIKIIGTGKRIGKTAVSTYTSRLIDKNNYNPCVVAMGRGGPETPEIVHGDKIEITPEFLVEQADKGVHAASDHWEDALMSRILTIGCRRCGGGMSGEVFFTNMKDGAKIANKQDADFIIFEGSGAAIPPIKTDKTIVLVGTNQDILNITNFFGPYRIGLGDLIILTMCEEPMTSKEKVNEIIEFIHKENPNAKVIPTVFRPKPLKNLEGKKILFATTAPSSVKDKLVNYLEEEYKCKVVGTTSHLSNRPLLKEDIAKYIDKVDCMLTELKAAAVDVASKEALNYGLEVVYCDNIPIELDGDYPSIDDSILELVDSAISDFNTNLS
ncbi:2,3-diphosphoglycerate synthetase [Methanobrevibacter sp. 87.7]|uniref:2,3-diphosphoglycerate synthetase n=1 Tax=Methanobrevibacter sp. 87.7 TaxID=387957 RepID=UPI000B5128BC|nr:2,3-diphosphoglycerate synthetase [Methanobrevibacter sp. 87.7]OWT33852.1 2,3-diphosphoglycerate synthetase [Methanobrevibacter sp. 87.7]